ncbi:uncharacterized protein LOC6494906 [Drosophila ananassae]|nr:uncharacterized protein LOC6494906 [Drosophila ananassae]
MGLAASICIKVLQLIATVAGLILKRWSDKYSERVFTINQKQSREWLLLNNLSWTREGDDFSTLTFVGYTFIASVLLLTRIIDGASNYSTCEVILLTCGVLFFTVEGLLKFFALEELPEELTTYAYSLGALSFFCAALFSLDLMLFKNLLKIKNSSAQTDQIKETVALKVYNLSQEAKTSCCSNTPRTELINEMDRKYLRTDL